jgi:hypothetical protein
MSAKRPHQSENLNLIHYLKKVVSNLFSGTLYRHISLGKTICNRLTIVMHG